MTCRAVARLALFLLATPVALPAQESLVGGRITGQVTVRGLGADGSGDGGEPVAGVTVRVVETGYSTLSDDRGRFVLGLVPPGTYVVEARRIGFRPERRLTRVLPDRDTELALGLMPAPVTVDALTVEALQDQGERTYALSRLQKVPLVGTANVTTVTQRDIELVHARDPWDLVREATGLEVHEQGQGPGFASDAVIRGFTSDHSADVALVVDGVPVNEPMNGHGEGYADWNLIFPSALADLQVIKGPISPLFGNFSTGGAVNITTQASTPQTSVRLEGGSNMYTAGTVTTGLEQGPWGAFLGANGVRSEGWRDNSAYRTVQIVGRGNRRLSPDLVVDAGAQYYWSDWRSPGFLSLDQFNAGLLTEATDSTDGGRKYRFQGRLAAILDKPSFQWSGLLWGYRSRWRLFLTIPELGGAGEGLGRQTEEWDRRTAFGGRSLARWRRGPSDLTAGAEAQRHESVYDIWGTVARGREITVSRFHATQVSLAGFATAAHEFGRLLRLEAGLRLDHVRPTSVDNVARSTLTALNRTLLSPKFGAVIYARGDLQFYGSASRGFRTAAATIGTPARPPVTVWALEAGARHAGRHVTTSVAVFSLATENELVFNPVTLQTEDTGESHRHGLEGELRVRPAPQVELTTHLTWNVGGRFHLADTTTGGSALSIRPLFHRSDGTASAATLHDVSARVVEGVADYSGRAGIVLQPVPAFRLNGWVTVMGPYVPLGEPEERTDPFAIVNLLAAAQLTRRIEVTIGLDNLLNTHAPELRASGAVNPAPLRTIHAGARATW